MIARRACGPSQRKANTPPVKRLSLCGNTAHGTLQQILAISCLGTYSRGQINPTGKSLLIIRIGVKTANQK
jgi:hypothetical protein